MDFLSFFLSGYIIPKGWRILVWFREVHFDPEVYPEPKKFDPSRWDVSIHKHFFNSCKLYIYIY